MLKHYIPQMISRNKLIIILLQNPADRQQVVSQPATRWKIHEAGEAFLLKVNLQLFFTVRKTTKYPLCLNKWIK